jgi:hypothetical protein
VQVFNVRQLVFDSVRGPEFLQEVCARYGVNFPQLLLHQWFERGEVNLEEARAYLADPSGWMAQSASSDGTAASRQVFTRAVAKRSLVADIVGVWDEESSISATPPGPVPG